MVGRAMPLTERRRRQIAGVISCFDRVALPAAVPLQRAQLWLARLASSRKRKSDWLVDNAFVSIGLELIGSA
jgi:hypothetical protein